MRQRDLNRAVARSTGETVTTISRFGFIPLVPEPIDREPRFLDWDELDSQRNGGRAPVFSSVPALRRK
ncbi:MAG TPA: hypothetical protein VNQ76_02670 [Planctomicrobium sp.]|nr:hypothetical protein [Planctomicrobium sp.]